MDLPINLDSNATFVTGVDELKQNLYLLLKEPIYTWYQSCKTGSRLAIHTADTNSLRIQAEETLKQIKGVEIESINVQDIYITIKLNYNGRELEQSFKYIE